LRGAIETITDDRLKRKVIMRKTSIARVATMVAIGLYFALAWGYTAVQALTSPDFGLADVWRSQMLFVLGHMLAFGPVGLVKLAAFLAAVKLVAAAFCAMHAIDRVRGYSRTEMLEGALIIVAGVAAAGCASAMWSHSNELFREATMQFALATVGIALCMVERALDRDAASEVVPMPVDVA
jgi:hypothetical protein